MAPLIDWERLRNDPEKEVARICTIHLANLMDVCVKHPAIVAYSVAMHERAKVEHERAKGRVQRVRARRFAMLSKAEPGRAVRRLELDVDADAEVESAETAMYEAQERVAVLRALVEGLNHRRDMLMHLAPRQRDELRNTPN